MSEKLDKKKHQENWVNPLDLEVSQRVRLKMIS